MSNVRSDIMTSPFSVEDIFLEGRDGTLHVITSGDPTGQPILFMHGITECARSFIPVMELLPSSFYAVSVDLRGRGESFKPTTHYTLEGYVNDLLAVMNLFETKKPVLVGHSLSGRIATAFSAQFPQLIEGLVLIDPPISGPGRRQFPLPLTRFTEPKIALANGNLEKFSSYYDSSKIDLTLKQQEMEDCSLDAIEQSYAMMNNEPFHAYYRCLSVSTLLLAANSPFITEDELVVLTVLNEHVTTKRIQTIGHEMFKEDPHLFIQEVLHFINELNLNERSEKNERSGSQSD